MTGRSVCDLLGRMSSHCHTLGAVTLILVHLLGSISALRTGIMDRSSFKFTQEAYNASILENSVGKTYMSPTVKMGIYINPTVDVRYRLTKGDDNKLFKTEARTVGDFCFLLIRTRSAAHSVINREQQEEYKLSIKAIGKHKRSGMSDWQTTTEIYVEVLDANDLSPLFHPTSYTAEVPEDTALHQRIIQVTASDADIGVNGEIYYSFSQETDTFAIHPTSGVVSLTKKLSYIEQNYYEINIIAQDRGPSLGTQKRYSLAKLEIRVQEVNFYSPQIEIQGLPAVVEHGKIGTIYGILYVQDRDYGSNGELKSVEIVDGDPHGYFRLDKGEHDGEYTIKVANTLDRELNQYGFNLTIHAMDKGNPPSETTKEIHVQIQDTNDNTPRFHQSVYEASIEECVPVHTPLSFVNATDPDYGKNAEIVYTITDGDDNSWFSIGSHSGLITVSSPLDAESSTHLTLTIQAQDQANKGSRRVSEAMVHVQVLDCNDNSPVFREPEPVASIEESLPVGTVVHQVSAFDLDSEDNGYISYSIANVDNMPFTIDHFTGNIMTKEVLDYESMRRLYSLVVRASDWGSPYRRESEIILKVQLRDINDNKPQFEKVDCTGYLLREAPVNTKLVTVSAIDFDVGNIISYQLVSGNEDGCFELSSSTGELKTTCNLKNHQGDFLSIVVTATDGENKADPTTVNITFVNNKRDRHLANSDASFTCQDTYVTEELGRLLEKEKENDFLASQDVHTPGNFIFSQNTYAPQFKPDVVKKISIQEGLQKGYQILTLDADDEDHGYNGRVMFVLTSGNTGGAFSMDTYKGDLVVMGNVDREVIKKYMLNITVTDMGKPAKSSSMLLEVDVEDVNDNPPLFEKPGYAVTVSEAIPVNTTVVQVVAHDRDEGNNAKVRYSIMSDTKHFAIDSITGMIRVNKELDRETNEEYRLKVKATDSAPENPLSSTVMVTIRLTDINDNAPRFVLDSYVMRVREDMPLHTVIMTISAEDPDHGSSGNVRYSFTEGTDGRFDIDKATGTVRIIQPLDYEQKQIYNITVRARDRGEPTKTSKCQFVVHVVDVNENMHAPKFKDFVFQGRVRENQPRNTSVLQLIASDMDRENSDASPKDYQIVYSIRDGSGMGRFTIDNKGIIRTNDVLDRESQSHYWLTVYAQDRGTVPLSSYVEVLIEVEDVNDNIPQTVDPVYYPSVLENSPEGTSVVTLQAYDLDDSKNNQITYHISSGNPQGFFIIDRNTGLIKTSNRKLDREKQEEHILEVTVSDNGVPQLSSTTRVVVNIEDDNDEVPKFTEALYRVRIPEMAVTNRDVSLYRILAYDNDKDANADIDYSIKDGKGNGRFKIHPKTGMIYSQKDFQADSQYELTVRAVDNGRPQQRSSVRVRFEVVARPSTSANPPQFVQEGVQAKVMEGDQIGTMITLMNAEDRDDDKIWYSITDGNTEDAFTIEPENGNILLARLLDWEERSMYNLTIRATDGVQDTYTWVQIAVLDINDNRPQFDLATYEIDIPENTARGTDILTVRATDRDEDQRLFYTIHSSTDQASRGKFKINSETGVITLTDSLNREAISRHELTIMVRDQGTPSKRSLARVIINIEDHNDNAPEFLGPVFTGRVYETAVVGSNVLQVMAVDRDKGKNAELKYSIVSGNVGSTFTIDGALGVVSLVKTLDRQTQSEYNMVVKAADGGSPSLTSTVPVHIEVTVSNNAPPKFEHEEYTAEILENQAEGTTITAVHATSRSSVVYDVISGNEDSSFIINPNSGVISSNVVFDYEQRNFYNLTVQGTNMVGASVTAMLLVHIIDQNDNQPIFNQEKYEGNFSESAQPGSVILDGGHVPLVIKAIDLDTNLNSLLTYSIVEAAALEVFEIDSTTGAVKTRISLDHERAPVYEFTVKVMDKGTPQQTASAPAKVTINVVDLNDSPPVFTEEVYTTTLLLPTYEGVEVLRVIAEDADLAVNSPLEYSIIRGNDQGHFILNPTSGVVTVTHAMDMLDYYEFVVRVSDGKYQAQCTVKIHVDYTQDSGLRFSRMDYYAEIEENSTVARQVAIVQAVGQALNEHLTFHILNPTPVFTVGETSGVVETTGVPLDREARDNLTVVVEVVDQRNPPRVAHVRVLVHVLDINDNVPVFVNQPYYAIVPVDASEGQTVKRVVAVDRDTGANGEVEYSLVAGGDGKLAVKRESGAIYLAQQLGGDDQSKDMTLTVRAQDKGTPPLSSEVQVPIVIMNKATPVFDEPYISVSVPENVPMHTAILTIEATSPTGKKLIYSITEGDIYGEFAVDFNTDMDALGPCSITVTESLDYEMRKSYDLKVRATDVDTGSSSEAIVHIQLEDVNDQTPSFLSLAYTATVSEAVSIGTSILAVTAEDRDAGQNAVVRYRIQNAPDSNDGQYFHIDPEQGVIFTKQRLDHEQTKRLLFTVVSTDSGIPALSSSVDISVVVTDLNDNPPKFDRPSYHATVTDQATRGQFVTIVTASDADSSDAGRLAYSIVDGNEGQAFDIQEFTGIVSLSSRKPQLLPQYLLNVSVTDGVFTNFARVEITVKGSNKHVPSFSQAVYDVDVTENTRVDKSIAVVTAVDADRGLYGQVRYHLESEDMDKVFKVNEKTGALYTRVGLDREAVALYQVPVKAVDGGGRVGYTTVRVNVADQGDNKPEFEMNEYKANIYSQAEEGTSVLQVFASDRDIGSNSDLEFGIYETQEDTIASQYFDVDAQEGTVLLKSSLDGLDNQLFQFFLRATDQGSPPMHSEVPVEIYVMGPVDRPPTYEQDQYTYFIPEDRPVGSTIATVKAESNESLSYTIVPGDQGRNNNPTKYGIDEEGKITLLEALDREETESFDLSIKAETKTSPPLVAYTKVVVNIMDVNDNTPRFESDPYTVSIAENGAVGSKVVQVIAHDGDTGANADVSYEFASADTRWSNVFAVDPQSGWITTLVELDREAIDLYSFNILARDRGAQIQLSDETTVKIRVTDHNDSPPVFTQEAYEGAVNEDALPGTIILMVSTADADLEQNARVAYHLTAGDSLGQFNVRGSGEVYVNRALDRESQSWYELTVSATDGAYVSTAKVYITILDANDNAPICEQPMYQQIIAENAQPGSFIVTVSASDLDEKDTRNARIEYLLSGDRTDTFNMHQRDGIISTKKILDREEQAKYHLKVTAMDGGGLYCTSDVYISLSDINDNPPRFSMSEYTVMIAEDAEVNTLLTRVSAVDFDLGINRKVQYAMKDNGEQFRIDEMSGIVSLTEGLDRERKAKYNLTIYAHDQGTPKMTSTAHLIVLLLDINDNPPEFERSLYQHTVPEDMAVGDSVLQVYATSRDTGVNAEITYSIVGGNEHGVFAMDAKSGVISLASGLDYEAVREYMLTIQGNDGGTPSLSNTAIVRINLTDANDNAPVFGQAEYNTEVLENAMVSSNVIQVQAMDRDSEPNAGITYSLVPGPYQDQFSIDPKAGFISIKSQLDRESIDSYSLAVVAVDSGTPSLTGSVTVNLEIQDVNDCPPAFTQSNYTAVLQENKELGCTIVRLEVTDADLDPNGAPFSFDIIDGNQGHEFKVDREGVISTAARFDRQIKDVYMLTARVFDNGSPPLYSDAVVEVRIVEESAFPPIVTPLVASVTAVDDSFAGGVVGRVKAYDKDAYDNLEFTLTPEDEVWFDIHPLDGTLTATQSLDPGVYHINVSVSDGKFTTTTTVELNVEGVTDEMTQNSVVIRFQNMMPEEFIGNHLTTFISLLKSDLGVRPRDIKVLGVQPASDTVITPSKRKRSTDSDLDVLLAVHKAQEKYYRGNALRRKLLQATETIENRLGTKIMKIFNDVCTKDSCVEGTCETIIHFDDGQMMTIITDKGSHVSAKHTLGYQCNCRPGWGGPYCSQEVDACTPNPCLPPRECEVDGVNFKCNCPDGLMGDDCNLVSKVDGETPLSFSGHSYMRWQMKLPMERRLSLSLKVKTVQRRARLMHAIGRVDYSILEIEDGMIQYRFDCGSGEGLARVDKIHVSDGYWHNVIIERNSRNIKIIIDDKFTGEGTAPGTNDVLNLDSNDLFFGAEVALLASGHDDIRQGYVGCMLAIKLESVELPFTGSNTVAIYKSSKDVDYHCRKMITASVCSSSPCFNGGTCIALGKEQFTCKCNEPRFSGGYCEFDTNPCESSPCLHGGICEKTGDNDYYCKCHSNLNGKRCELNYFCLNNPCKNRGKCRDGDTGPVCECERGFTGTYCDQDVNECEKSPCQNGATCQNLYGGFRCNCSSEVTGDLCELVNFPAITSSSMGISLEEILGIAGVVLGILVLVIVFILVIRWRRRKRRRQNSMLNTSRDSSDLKLKCGDDYKRSHKMNNISSNLINLPPSPRNPNHHVPSPRNSPRPPPVPTRPASYTPSAAESMNTLNNCNFDSARNYGSAADDLEVSGTLREPIEIPDFLTNVDVDKYPEPVQRSLPPPPAEEEPLLPNKWDPNFAQNYPDGYHWDTSDWNPTAGAPLHSIAEVPLTEIRDSGSSHSNDSNVHIDPGEYEYTDYPDEEYDEGQDSEYVGDSEYAENEFAGEDTDDPDAEYPDRPDFQDILAMQGELDYGDVDRPERRYEVHPDTYLPGYNISQGSQPGEDWADPGPGKELNGNLGPPDTGEDDGVIHYGFPSNSLRQPQFRARPISYAESDYYDQPGVDEMSISMGGYTSTNASMSDVSEVRLCEIDDSEANNSEDSADENTNLTKPQGGKQSKGKRKDSRTHTVV